ncbi:hypothetical protein D3C80_1648660 [compost metagenome]
MMCWGTRLTCAWPGRFARIKCCIALTTAKRCSAPVTPSNWPPRGALSWWFLRVTRAFSPWPRRCWRRCTNPLMPTGTMSISRFCRGFPPRWRRPPRPVRRWGMISVCFRCRITSNLGPLSRSAWTWRLKPIWRWPFTTRFRALDHGNWVGHWKLSPDIAPLKPR